MEFKGTPAPWTGNISGDNASIDIILPNNTTISVDRQDRYSSEYIIERTEMEANAKLISKAPEILELLEHVLALSKYGSVIDPYKVENLIKEIKE